jgi:hypothetical protein
MANTILEITGVNTPDEYGEKERHCASVTLSVPRAWCDCRRCMDLRTLHNAVATASARAPKAPLHVVVTGCDDCPASRYSYETRECALTDEYNERPPPGGYDWCPLKAGTATIDLAK